MSLFVYPACVVKTVTIQHWYRGRADLLDYIMEHFLYLATTFGVWCSVRPNTPAPTGIVLILMNCFSELNPEYSESLDLQLALWYKCIKQTLKTENHQTIDNFVLSLHKFIRIKSTIFTL